MSFVRCLRSGVERAEMDLASRDEPEHMREAPDDARRRDPALRLALAHPELASAEVPHRRARVHALEPPVFDLDQVCDELRVPDVPLADVATKPEEQLVVGQIPEFVHERL